MLTLSRYLIDNAAYAMYACLSVSSLTVLHCMSTDVLNKPQCLAGGSTGQHV